MWNHIVSHGMAWRSAASRRGVSRRITSTQKTSRRYPRQHLRPAAAPAGRLARALWAPELPVGTTSVTPAQAHAGKLKVGGSRVASRHDDDAAGAGSRSKQSTERPDLACEKNSDRRSINTCSGLPGRCTRRGVLSPATFGTKT